MYLNVAEVGHDSETTFWHSGKSLCEICRPLQVASQLENSVSSALDAGYRTADLYTEGTKKVGCKQLGDILSSFIREPIPA